MTFFVSFELFNAVLDALNMKLELVLNTNVLSDICFQLLHDFFIHLWGTFNTGEIGSFRSHLGLRYVL